MNGTIYKLTFPDNMVYIGSTKNLSKRLSAHRSNGKHAIPCISAMIAKYGSFNCEVWSETRDYEDVDDLREAEYQLMQTIPPDKLLNERSNFDSVKPNDFSTPISTQELALLYGFD